MRDERELPVALEEVGDHAQLLPDEAVGGELDLEVVLRGGRREHLDQPRRGLGGNLVLDALGQPGEQGAEVPEALLQQVVLA